MSALIHCAKHDDVQTAALLRKGHLTMSVQTGMICSTGALHLCDKAITRLLLVHQLVYQTRCKISSRTATGTARRCSRLPAGTLHVRAFAIRTRHERQGGITRKRN